MPTNEKILAIVIPVWDKWLYTQRTLLHLQKLPENHLVIIVDNESVDQTKRLNSIPCREVIHTTRLSFSKSCNLGYFRAKELGYENVMFLSNDIKISERYNNWTYPLIGRARGGEVVAALAEILNDDLNFVSESFEFINNSYLSSWCLTSSIKVWEHLIPQNEIGPFSSVFENICDIELFVRIHNMGIPTDIIPVPLKRRIKYEKNISEDDKCKLRKIWIRN